MYPNNETYAAIPEKYNDKNFAVFRLCGGKMISLIMIQNNRGIEYRIRSIKEKKKQE